MYKIFSKKVLAVAVGGMLATSANAFVVNETFSGNWSEGAGNRGLIIDILPTAPGRPANDFSNDALVQWFTYRDGEPVWLISDRPEIDKNTNTAELEFFEFAGGTFGPLPDQGNPQRSFWGNASLRFTSCNTATMEFDGIDSFGTLVLQNNTPKAQCVVDAPFESCPDFSQEVPGQPGFCVISGDITEDTTLTNETHWILSGQVNVDNGATLTIEPGTEITGGTDTNIDFMVIRRDAKIIAEGTPFAPIVMRGFESRDRGEWGGLVINGNAPINGCAPGTALCEAEGEGDSGLYGGNDPMDSSGRVRYLVLANGGFEFSPSNELNGIALQGVGAGTLFEFVQSHLGADDAIEPFGGTVNLRNLVLTGAADDSFDWVLGYIGNVQYVMIKQYNDLADRGIESDNLNANNDSLPRSNPTLANFTIIGSEASSQGVLHRRGTAGLMANFIITGSGGGCVDVDDAATFAQADQGDLRYFNSVAGNCVGGTFENDGDPFDVEGWWVDNGNLDANPLVGGPNGTMLQPGSPAIGIGVVPFEDAFFDKVDFAGAFAPGAPDWTAGWTVGLDRDAP